jgi:outer membrane immunogenic protein
LIHSLEKMMKRVLAAAFALSFGGTAYAADMPVPYKASAPAPVFTWTGCYVGGNGRPRHWLVRWRAGRLRLSGQFLRVFGIEGQFDWADMHGVALVTQAGGAAGLQLS